MASHPNDHELGMHRRISRRDFLNGMAIGVGGLLAADPKSFSKFFSIAP